MPFTTTLPLVNQSTPATRKPQRGRGGQNRLSPLTQALDMRDLTFKRLQTEELTPVEHSRMTRAWVELCGIVRDLQGIGRPKTVTARNDPEAKARNKAKIGLLPEPIALPDPKAG